MVIHTIVTSWLHDVTKMGGKSESDTNPIHVFYCFGTYRVPFALIPEPPLTFLCEVMEVVAS